MKEEDLKIVPVIDLVDLMVKSIGELSSFRKFRDRERMTLKTKEIQLIHTVIASKRKELLPVNQ